MSMAEDAHAFAVGDLVWVQVKGHPVWPGQVMNPDTAPKAARAQRRKNDTILVAFFGDASFGWFDADVVQPFKEHVETYKKQRNAKQKVDERGIGRGVLGDAWPCVLPSSPHGIIIIPPHGIISQTFKIAVEEATELMIRREGGTPPTNHDPPDFLNPRETDFAPDVSSDEEMEDPRAAHVIKVAPPAVHEDSVLQAADPGASLAWLMAGAQAPEMVDVDAVDGGLVLSLLKHRCVDPECTAFSPPSKVCIVFGVIGCHAASQGACCVVVYSLCLDKTPHPTHHQR